MAEPKSKELLMTVTEFSSRDSVDEIITTLRGKKLTGQLTVDVSQGGLQKIAFTEKQKVEVTE